MFSRMALRSTITFGATAPNLASNPIRPEWILEGAPTARIQKLSQAADGSAATYLWDCTAGRFNWFYAFDETFHILEGTISLKEFGETRIATAGDTVFFPVGSSAEWTVEKYVRKLAFCRFPLPEYINTARRLVRRVRGIIRGDSAGDNNSGLL
jgi:uncharacterized protein